LAAPVNPRKGHIQQVDVEPTKGNLPNGLPKTDWPRVVSLPGSLRRERGAKYGDIRAAGTRGPRRKAGPDWPWRHGRKVYPVDSLRRPAPARDAQPPSLPAPRL